MATTVKHHQMFIGGEWVDGSGDESQPIVSPATGQVIAEVPKATAQDVDRAVAAAKRAFEETWFDSTPKDRMDALLKLADRIDEHQLAPGVERHAANREKGPIWELDPRRLLRHHVVLA